MVEEGPGGIHSLGQEEQVQFRRFQFELRLKDLLLKNLTGRHVGRLRKESVDPIPPHIEIQEVLALKSSVLLGAIENGFKRRYKKLSKNKKTRGIEIREALRFLEIEIPDVPLSDLGDFLERAYRLLAPEDDYLSPPPS